MVDSLESKPEILTTPYFEDKLDTGETIMHLLAKEGCVEPLRKILDMEEHPKIDIQKLVEAILQDDNAGWSPLMTALKADRNVEDIVELFLKFLEEHANTEDIKKMINQSPKVTIRLYDF